MAGWSTITEWSLPAIRGRERSMKVAVAGAGGVGGAHGAALATAGADTLLRAFWGPGKELP